MGKFLFFFCIIAISLSTVNAQTRNDKLYTVSGIGTSIPIASSNEVFGPKISTTLGLNLGLGNANWFLYPKLSLHAFSYRGKRPEPGFEYTAQTGRATTYLLNIGAGYRKTMGKFAIYGFLGAGGGFILTPMVRVNEPLAEVKLSNKTHFMPIIESGAGTEFSLGALAIFIEAGYMNGFKQIQDRNFGTMPLTFGIKPNLSRLFKP